MLERELAYWKHHRETVEFKELACFCLGVEHGIETARNKMPVSDKVYESAVKGRRDFRAALRSERDLHSWQPIESAPKNGTYILLWWRTCKRACVGHYVCEGDLGEEWFRFVKEGWINDGDQIVPRNQKDCTHWMPLPTPPSA